MESPFEGEEKAGLDRRTVIRRGAILGGALVWTAPAVQTIAGPAFAAGSPCVPGAVIFLDNNANGRFDAGDTCVGTVPFANGPAGDCCSCFESNGGMSDAVPALAICTGNGSCVPGVFQPGLC